MNRVCIVLLLLTAAGPLDRALATPWSIYEIQSDTYDGDGSNFDGAVIDCAGGVVVAKFPGWRPRVILQDPARPDGWGAIQVKDWTITDLYPNVEIGDWVQLYDVEVQEFRGNTLLQWDTTVNNPSFTIVSRDNPVPEPIMLAPADIPAPLEDPDHEDEWYVLNHDAEPYEAMRVVVRDVTVTRKSLGKAVDNYNLQDSAGDDCWAADYMNDEVESTDYHRFVELDQHFCAVAGLFEQYTKTSDGWDYYQIVTQSTTDLAICGDGNSDGVVSLGDLPRFEECLTGPLCDGVAEPCDSPTWMESGWDYSLQHCLMMDLNYDLDVDLADFAGLQLIFAGP